MITLIVLSVMFLISLTALGFSVYLNVKLGRTILSFEDQVEESLDILDESYQRIAAIAVTPVMSDDPFIRDVMLNIRSARDSVLLVANKLVKFEPAPFFTDQDDDRNNTET